MLESFQCPMDQPPSITLFFINIWNYADQNLRRFHKEVALTLHHEIGHYLGLDELDLSDRGLA